MPDAKNDNGTITGRQIVANDISGFSERDTVRAFLYGRSFCPRMGTPLTASGDLIKVPQHGMRNARCDRRENHEGVADQLQRAEIQRPSIQASISSNANPSPLSSKAATERVSSASAWGDHGPRPRSRIASSAGGNGANSSRARLRRNSGNVRPRDCASASSRSAVSASSSTTREDMAETCPLQHER